MVDVDVDRLRRVAHDLRNALANVLSIAGELEERGDPEIKPLVAELVTTTELAGRLSALLLAPTASVEDAVSCQPAVVLEALQPTLERVVAPFALVVRAGDTGPIGMPADSLRRVLINLARNARNAVGPNGRVWIELVAVTLGERTPPRWVELTVADNGGSNGDGTRQGGAGVGLRIVHELAAWAGGSVRIMDGDQGWRVRVLLPQTSS